MDRAYTFSGAAHKHNLITEELEDLGGIVLEKRILSYEAFITFVLSEDDIDIIKNLAQKLRGEIKSSPLLGSEIAVIAPSISRHHLPNILCDVAEYLRKFGAKTNIIGLAQGVGQKIAQITPREKIICEEYDIAIFVVGNFKHCILDHKKNLFNAITKVPVLVLGGPQLENPPFNYIGGFGRIPHRLQTLSYLPRLNEVISNLKSIIEDKQRLQSYDPFFISPFVLKRELERQILDIKEVIDPSPVVCNLNGVRLKLPYDVHSEQVRGIKIAGKSLGSISKISRSQINNHILIRLTPNSGFSA